MDELCRPTGISRDTWYMREKTCGGMSPPEARPLKELEEENWRPTRIVADQERQLPETCTIPDRG